MSEWQDIVAVLIALGSAAYLVRLGIRAVFPPLAAKGCGACSACPSNSTPNAEPMELVRISPALPRSKSHK
jgi:hypothetical protein